MTAKKKTPKRNKRGFVFSQEIADLICERVASGLTVRKLTEADDMPDRTTVTKWEQKHPAFALQLTRARVTQMLAWADDIVFEADDAVDDWKITVDLDSKRLSRIEKDGKVEFRLDAKHIRRAELKIKTRQWLMERLNSETFGLRQFLDVTQSWDSADDKELIEGFRAAAANAGMTLEKLAEWLGTKQ